MTARDSKLKPQRTLRCSNCGRPHGNPEGFCCQVCKEDAQRRGLGLPIRLLPVKYHFPRLRPEEK